MAAARKAKLTIGLRKAGAGSAVARVTEAAIAMREGFPVAIRDGKRATLAFSVETIGRSALAEVNAKARLVLTHARARTLKMRLYTPEVVALALAPRATPEQLRAIADPTFDLAEPLKGPFEALRETLPPSFAASIKLAKLSGLLPATIVIPVGRIPPGVRSISSADIADYERESVATLVEVTRARVPLDGAENTELVAFRAKDGGPEHYAIVIGAPTARKPVLTRLHSECFTGDLLGSLKCDCGAQLRGAIAAIEKAGGGVLLYLAQEGRGIGLINKLRAYRLQDQGFDTHTANERLGFEPDERLYGIAAKMLSLLGYSSVRLLTNNPDKVKALEAAGIEVAARVPHRFPGNRHNRAYLKAKAQAGHLL